MTETITDPSNPIFIDGSWSRAVADRPYWDDVVASSVDDVKITVRIESVPPPTQV